MTQNNSKYLCFEQDKCKSSGDCVEVCPVGAIATDRQAEKINYDKCVYCGECIRVCPKESYRAVVDDFEKIFTFEHRIVIPDPALYGQFRNANNMDSINNALLGMGFHRVISMFEAAMETSLEIRTFIKNNPKKLTISSLCPAVSELVRQKYPKLLSCLLEVQPLAVFAQRAVRKGLENELGAELASKVGVFFITPCPARANELREMGFDGVLSMKDVYPLISEKLNSPNKPIENSKADFPWFEWSISGEQGRSAGVQMPIFVEGIFNVINILEDISKGSLSNVDFAELYACQEGCMGGPLTVENPYISRARLNKYLKSGTFVDDEQPGRDIPLQVAIKESRTPDPLIKMSLLKGEEFINISAVERIVMRLPGIDCGKCGSNTCHALAVKVTQGVGRIEECEVMMRFGRIL